MPELNHPEVANLWGFPPISLNTKPLETMKVSKTNKIIVTLPTKASLMIVMIARSRTTRQLLETANDESILQMKVIDLGLVFMILEAQIAIESTVFIVVTQGGENVDFKTGLLLSCSTNAIALLPNKRHLLWWLLRKTPAPLKPDMAVTNKCLDATESNKPPKKLARVPLET